MKSFATFLKENSKEVCIAYFDMDPPFYDYASKLEEISEKFKRVPLRIYLTSSEKNLACEEKVKLARKNFPKYGREIKGYMSPESAAEAAYNDGYTILHMIVERGLHKPVRRSVEQFQDIRYKFQTIDVIPVDLGRTFDLKESLHQFSNFAPFFPNLDETEIKTLFNDLRKRNGLGETKDFRAQIDLEPVSDMREKYVKGHLFSEGDQVVITKSDEVGTICSCGPNYLVIETANGSRLRKWITDVEKLE